MGSSFEIELEKKYKKTPWYKKLWWTIYRIFWHNPGEKLFLLKMAWQRAVRGYDDLLLWNVNTYIIEHFLIGLTFMRANKHGYPVTADSLEEWQQDLNTMIEGFEAIKQVNESIGLHHEHTVLMLKFHKAWELAEKHFLGLWD